MKNLKLILTLTVLSTFFSCVNGDDYGTPDLTNQCMDLTKTKEVIDVTSIATSNFQKWTGDDVIEAYVTSSDEGGNFYKSISLVSIDGTIGFSMPIDDYNLYNKYEPGRKVSIKMKDRYFSTSQSSTIIGSLFNNYTPENVNDDAVGRMTPAEYKEALVRSCSKIDENDIVNNLTVAQALSNSNLNKLIEFNNVQFTDPSLGKTYYDPTVNSLGGATNHTITDEFGNTIILRVSEFATFSGDVVSSKSGKIRGVLTKFGSTFQFMVRTINDIQLTNPRLDIDFFPPIVGNALVFNATLNEPFTSYTSNNQENFPMYINDAATGNRYWQRKVFGGNTYIQMSSFGGGNTAANRSLFIVPVNFTAANTLSFKTKAGYDNGPTLKVYYSLNYVPGNQISNATLIDITSSFSIPTGLSNGYPTNFSDSGNYNIPASLTGNGYFVFEYVGNGASGPTTTMQIDDIIIN